MQTDKERLEEATKALTKTAEDLAASQAENEGLKVELAKATKPADPVAPAADEVIKSLPAEVQKMFTDQEALVKAANAKIESLEGTVTKAENDRLDREAVAKAKTDFPDLTVDHEAVGKALRVVSAVSPEIAKSLETALTAASAQVKESSLFKSAGVRAGSAAGGALDQLTTLAKAAAVADKTTLEVAMAKVSLANPALAAQYQAELAGN